LDEQTIADIGTQFHVNYDEYRNFTDCKGKVIPYDKYIEYMTLLDRAEISLDEYKALCVSVEISYDEYKSLPEDKRSRCRYLNGCKRESGVQTTKPVRYTKFSPTGNSYYELVPCQSLPDVSKLVLCHTKNLLDKARGGNTDDQNINDMLKIIEAIEKMKGDVGGSVADNTPQSVVLGAKDIADYPYQMQAASGRGNPTSVLNAYHESIEEANEPADVVVKNRKPIDVSDKEGIKATKEITAVLEDLPEQIGRSTVKWLEKVNLFDKARQDIQEEVYSDMGFTPVEVVEKVYPNASDKVRRKHSQRISKDKSKRKKKT
jgi:hypothetical protein